VLTQGAGRYCRVVNTASAAAIFSSIGNRAAGLGPGQASGSNPGGLSRRGVPAWCGTVETK
jgi:hypothetical protein